MSDQPGIVDNRLDDLLPSLLEDPSTRQQLDSKPIDMKVVEAACDIWPMWSKVLIVRRTVLNRTKSGLIVPDTTMKRSNQGVVLRIGPDCTTVKVGDEVLVQNYSGRDITIGIEGIELLLVPESECEAIVAKQLNRALVPQTEHRIREAKRGRGL